MAIATGKAWKRNTAYTPFQVWILSQICELFSILKTAERCQHFVKDNPYLLTKQRYLQKLQQLGETT